MQTILVVDDEKKVRSIYRKYFEDEGFNIIEASSVKEAKENLNKEYVDLMLLDINMPEIGGEILYEVTQLFNRNLKVIVTSVYPVTLQREKIEGAVDYFDKSEGLNELIEKVNKVLRGNELESDECY